MVRDAERQADAEHRFRDRERKSGVRYRRRKFEGDGPAPAYWGDLAEFDRLVEEGRCLWRWATARPCAGFAEPRTDWCAYHAELHRRSCRINHQGGKNGHDAEPSDETP